MRFQHSIFSRPLLSVLFVGAVVGTACFGLKTLAAEPNDELPFFIGTYTGGKSEGIYRSGLNPNDGSMSPARLMAKLTNPSFLCLHPKLKVLYAVSEVADGDKQIAAYSFNNDELQLLNSLPTAGSGPCYVSTDQSGRFVFVANYGSGSICSISTTDSGALDAIVSKHQHSGSSVNPNRQRGPHAHCIQVDPTNQFVCAVDLGIDKIVVYKLEDSGSLTEHSSFQCTPGNGPRHLAFHPNGQYAFVIHELTCRLSCLKWDDSAGEFKELQQVSTLPDSIQNGFSTAEVLVHPSGNFVYGSNRGHDSIAVFRFAEGKLTRIQNASTQGKTPRNFRIDPTGRYLLAENQNSDSIYSLQIDPTSGELKATGHKIDVGSPVCIKFSAD